MEMSERYLLFASGVACGIFPTDAIFIILSSDGEFVNITRKSGDAAIHMTQFTPRPCVVHVTKVLKFRNRYSHMPPCYFSESLSSEYAHVSISQQACRWNLCKIGTTSFSSVNSPTMLTLCPYGRLVMYRGPVRHARSGGMSSVEADTVSCPIVESVFPVNRCPVELTGLLNILCSESTSQCGRFVLTNFLSAGSHDCDSPHRAVGEFHAVGQDLSRLADPCMYPTADVVVVEHMHGTTYSYSGANAADGALHTICVEMWPDEVMSDEPCGVRPEFMSLRNDLLCVQSLSEHDGGVNSFSLHVSLFDCESTGNALGGPVTKVMCAKAVRGHALRLVGLRDHIKNSFHGVKGVCTNSDTTREWKLIYGHAVKSSHGADAPKRRPPAGTAILNSHRSENGDCLTLLANGTIRGVFPSSRIILQLDPTSNVSGSTELIAC